MSRLVHDPRALRDACDAFRSEGLRVGFVPTMGALHAGHISLCDAVRARGAERVVVSIFVNPLQFGPKEDFAKYPRTLADDTRLCDEHGVDLIYAPEVDALYPPGFQTHVEVEQLTQGFDGAARPTHFRGVTTVVAKLLNTVGPCVAAFGRKDYQQWRVIERMVRDLDLPVEVIGCPIRREPDGLAMSSRNRYLSPEQRQRATAIVLGLRAADAAYRRGERSAPLLEALARAPIAERFDSIDYVTLADAESLRPCVPASYQDVGQPAQRPDRPLVLLVAARIGQTRLIDNAELGRDALG
jgi:pantoate--beta-alanine ligase